MRISSNDGRCRIEITRNLDEDSRCESFSLEATVDVGHGKFSGRNEEVHFLNIDDFAASLDAFILNRALKPCLEATYDSFIRVSGIESRVTVQFAVGDAVCWYPDMVEFRLTGEFEFEQEYLVPLVAFFRERGEEHAEV